MIHFTKVLKKMMLSYYKMIKIHLTTKKMLRIFKLVKRYPAGQVSFSTVFIMIRESLIVCKSKLIQLSFSSEDGKD